MKVLLVEDDVSVSKILSDSLGARFHTVDCAADGAEGIFLARAYDFDVIVLDYSLPKKNGLVFCRELRAAGKQTPVIFLSVNDDPAVKLAAFESGADDYVTKPFSMEELNARVLAVSRRQPAKQNSVFTVDDLELDVDRNTVTRGGQKIHLTRKEFMLLEYMMRHAGMVLSRAMILEHVWTADRDSLSNTVEAHILNLRKKLNAGGKANLIANIQSRGYILDKPENLARM